MNPVIQFELSDDSIELFKILKAVRIASSGGEAKAMIENGDIYLNNNLEYRKRAKIRKGDKITFQSTQILII